MRRVQCTYFVQVLPFAAVCAHLGKISHPAHRTEPMENHKQLSSVIEFSSVSSEDMAGCSHSIGVILKTYFPQRSGRVWPGPCNSRVQTSDNDHEFARCIYFLYILLIIFIYLLLLLLFMDFYLVTYNIYYLHGACQFSTEKIN